MLESYILISSPDSKISFYSTEQKEKAMGQNSYQEAQENKLIDDLDKELDTHNKLKQTLDFQDTYLNQHNSRFWVTSTTVGKFSRMQKQDFANMFDDLIDVHIKTESKSTIDDIKNQKKEYNNILVKIAETINKIQKGELLDKLYEILKKQSESKIDNKHFGQITNTTDLIDLFRIAEEKKQTNCMLVLLANCPEIDSKVAITADSSAYSTFFSLYEPLYRELIDTSDCFLSFEELGAAIHQDTRKTLYIMQKEIEKSQKWVKTFCDPETDEIINWRSSCEAVHLYRTKTLLYFFIFKSFHKYLEERKEECDEYSSFLIKHFIEDDGKGFLRAVYNFQHNRNFSHAGMADVNRAAKKELAYLNKMENDLKKIEQEIKGLNNNYTDQEKSQIKSLKKSLLEEKLKERYGEKVITIQNWQTASLRRKIANNEENKKHEEQKQKIENKMQEQKEQELRAKEAESKLTMQELGARNGELIEAIHYAEEASKEQDKTTDEYKGAMEEKDKTIEKQKLVIADLMCKLEKQNNASSKSPSKKLEGATAAAVDTEKYTRK